MFQLVPGVLRTAFSKCAPLALRIFDAQHCICATHRRKSYASQGRSKVSTGTQSFNGPCLTKKTVTVRPTSARRSPGRPTHF